MTRRQMFLFALVAMFCTGCAGMTAAETTGVVAAGGGALVAIIDALSPYLPPEKVAELTTHVGNAENLIGAIARGVGAVAEATQQAQQAALEAKQQAAEGITRGEALTAGGALAGVSVGGSRVLSILKHNKAAKQPTA